MNTTEKRMPEDIQGLSRKFLEVRKKRGDTTYHQEKEIRTWAFSKVIEFQGDNSKIGFFVTWLFSQIAANNLGGKSDLVSDMVKVWPVAYPGDEIGILKAIISNASGYIQDGQMGEGIIIALLELVNEGKSEEFEKLVFDCLFKGEVMSCMRISSVTASGKGRITNALSVFVKGVWNQGDRRGHLRLVRSMLLTRRLRCVISPSTVLIFPDLTHQDLVNVLELFADELLAKLFLESSFTMRSYIVCSYLKHMPNSPLEAWLAQCPEYACASPV